MKSWNDFVEVWKSHNEGNTNFQLLYVFTMCTTLLVQFFGRWSFNKKMLYMYFLKYCALLVTSSSHVLGSVWISCGKNWWFLNLSTNRSDSCLPHDIGSAGHPGHAPRFRTADLTRKKRTENITWPSALPSSVFSNMYWLLWQRGVRRCEAQKSIYPAPSLCYAYLSFIAWLKILIVFDI